MNATRSRLLVIDDDLALGKTLRMLLAPEMDVTVESDAQAGLDRLLGSGDGSFHAVLCDLNMPQLSGMELHRLLTRERPGLANLLIFMTGGAFTPDARAFLEKNTHPTLEKPFTLRQLHAALAALSSPR